MRLVATCKIDNFPLLKFLVPINRMPVCYLTIDLAFLFVLYYQYS